MRITFLFVSAALVASAFAEKQPFERYQTIVDRQMFGRAPEGFNPDIPPELAPKGGSGERSTELTREQEVLKSAVHFSAINVTPDGDTAVGFTDSSDPKAPVHYYLKVGETRGGWKVVEADPLKAKMKIVKDEVEVELTLGENSAKGGGAARGRTVAADPRGVRGASYPGRRNDVPGSAAQPPLASLRERRAARELERLAQEEREKAEREAREKDREEQRRQLLSLKDELKAQRDELAKEREAREEAERLRAEQQSNAEPEAESHAEDDN